MFKLSEIKELVKLLDQTSIQEIEIENEGSRLMIRKPNKTESVVVASPVQHAYSPVHAQPMPVQPAVAAPAPAAAVQGSAAQDSSPAGDAGLHKIVSPMVGTFYQAPSPGAEVFVKKGDKVTDKTIVCIVEAMKLMNEIEAEVKGEIVEILVENGQLVEYGQPLFLVRT